MRLTLSKQEYWLGTQIGTMRQVSNLYKGRKDAYGAEKMNGFEININGACGEVAVAKWLNIFYSGNLGDLAAGDVNHPSVRIEVRTAFEAHYRMILHKKDRDDAIFILLTGTAPEFIVRGWCYGREGKQEKFWADPAGGRPAYFVPQAELRPIDELKKLLL